MTREEKENIDRLVNIWLSGLQSSTADAGWEGMSLAARLIEYEGQPPAPTGNDQSNLAMINAIRLLRDRHAEYPLIAAAMSMLLRGRNTTASALSISAKHFYTGLCPWSDKAWTDADRARSLEMSHQEFRWALGKAYPLIQQEIDRVRTYMRYIA